MVPLTKNELFTEGKKGNLAHLVVTAPQPCVIFAFLSIVFNFTIIPFIAVIQINCASYFRLRNVSYLRVHFIFSPLFLLLGLALLAVSSLVAVVITF